MSYRATMRQGLVFLALLGTAVGLETILPADRPDWVGSVITMVERGLFVLVIVVLVVSVFQRGSQIVGTVRNPTSLPAEKRGVGGFIRVLLTTPHGPFLVLHGGLIVLIAAFGYAKSGAVEAVMELPIGSESRVAVLGDGRRLSLPFTVRATAFDTDHYESGEVKQFVGGIDLIPSDGEARSFALGVGEPLDYRGHRFSLFRFGYTGSRVEGSVRAIADPLRSTGYRGEVGGALDAGTEAPISLVTLVEHATRRTPDGDRDIGRALVYQVTGRDGAPYEVMTFESAAHVVDYRPLGEREFESVHVLATRDAAMTVPFSHYLTVSAIEPRKTVALQIRRYPGLTLLLVSSAIVVLGVAWMLAFWKPPSQTAPVTIPSRRRPNHAGADQSRSDGQIATPAALAPISAQIGLPTERSLP